MITWKNVTVKLGDLKPWARNPRQIKKDQAERLSQSFDEFGQVETIAIGPSGDVYNGHQRLSVLLNKHGKNYAVEARVSDRELTEKEREKLTVFLHKGAAGEWNFDTLANEFDMAELVEWGFKPYELGIPGEDAANDPDREWEGMPEFVQEDAASIKSIKVNFYLQADIDEFAKIIGQQITKKTISINYPYRERAEILKMRVQDES